METVSGYARDAEKLKDYGKIGSKVPLTIPRDGQKVEACFVFTDIAGDDLVEAVESALDARRP